MTNIKILARVRTTLNNLIEQTQWGQIADGTDVYDNLQKAKAFVTRAIHGFEYNEFIIKGGKPGEKEP